MAYLGNLVDINVNAYENNSDFFIQRTDGADVKTLTDKFSDYVGSGRILDVGCAQGRDSLTFYNKGFEIVGIDLAENLLKEAEKRVPEGFFYKMDARRLDFSPESFNGIFAMGLLLCMDKEGARLALSEFSRVGTKNAKLYLALKKGEGILESKLGNDMTVQTLFGKQEFDEMLVIAGWKTDDYFETESVIKDPVVWMNYFCQKD